MRKCDKHSIGLRSGLSNAPAQPKSFTLNPNYDVLLFILIAPWSIHKSTVVNNDHSNFTYLIWLPSPIQKVWIVFVWGENAFIFCYKVMKK